MTIGLAMLALSALGPVWASSAGMTMSSTRALWLATMGTVNGMLGAGWMARTVWSGVFWPRLQAVRVLARPVAVQPEMAAVSVRQA